MRKPRLHSKMSLMLNQASAGARVVLASCTDSRHPPENMLDRDPQTYWITTGCFPHEAVISLPSPEAVTSIRVTTCNVRKLCIHRRESEEKGFQLVVEKELDSRDGRLQLEEFKLQEVVPIHQVKLVLVQAYHHFATVHSISIHS